jgi:hypothetical protein
MFLRNVGIYLQVHRLVLPRRPTVIPSLWENLKFHICEDVCISQKPPWLRQQVKVQGQNKVLQFVDIIMHETSRPDYNHKYLPYMMVNILCQPLIYHNRRGSDHSRHNVSVTNIHLSWYIYMSPPQFRMHILQVCTTAHWPHLYRHSAGTSVSVQLISGSQQIN